MIQTRIHIKKMWGGGVCVAWVGGRAGGLHISKSGTIASVAVRIANRNEKISSVTAIRCGDSYPVESIAPLASCKNRIKARAVRRCASLKWSLYCQATYSHWYLPKVYHSARYWI